MPHFQKQRIWLIFQLKPSKLDRSTHSIVLKPVHRVCGWCYHQTLKTNKFCTRGRISEAHELCWTRLLFAICNLATLQNWLNTDMKKLLQVLHAANSVSITSNNYVDQLKNDANISITTHFISDKWKQNLLVWVFYQ